MRIAVVAPSRAISPELAERVVALAAEVCPEAEVRVDPRCFSSHGHFAGDDETRAAAFVDAANDPEVDAVWFARGGYGAFRIVPLVLPALGAAARRKTYLGYSDGGALLAALYGAGIGRIAHGPMPADLNRAGGAAAVARALAFLTRGDAASIEPSATRHAPVAAFNLTILAHLIGTPWLPDLSGHVLMLEEVSEPVYRIDRALAQVASAPALAGLAGLMLGRCGEIVPNDPDFGRDEEDVAREWCARSGIPWLGRADIGHDVANKVVPFG